MNTAAKGEIQNEQFLETEKVVDILTKSHVRLNDIPCGLKENGYFVLDNEINMGKTKLKTRKLHISMIAEFGNTPQASV